MIKRRLYFLLPDIEHTNIVVSDLLDVNIDERQMHAIAGQGVDSQRLPVDIKKMSADYGARFEPVLWMGNLILFAIAFIAFIALLMSLASGYWWVLPAGLMMLTFFSGLEFVTRIPNAHLAEFQDAMRHHEVLLMIDVPYQKKYRR